MRIHVYAVCYNEQTMMPFFLRHYARFADAITIFDNQSNDGTVNIIKEFQKTTSIPIYIISYNTDNRFSDAKNLQLKNMTLSLSKEKDDWIIVVDTDELIYHSDIRSKLSELEEYDVIHPRAYHMIGEDIPPNCGMLYDYIIRGAFDYYHSKPCIINTHRINILDFDAGAHHLQTDGGKVLNWSDNNIKMLHYKWLCPEYVISNYRRNAERLSDENLRRGWGFHYRWDDNKIREEYENLKKKSEVVI
jgi:glycosyltransferase involved in cell wall biosynthesis